MTKPYLLKSKRYFDKRGFFQELFYKKILIQSQYLQL